MRLLLDTHVVLWLLQEPERLGQRAVAALRAESVNLVSVVTFIEVGIKVATGKLVKPDGFDTSTPGERLLPITPVHGLALEQLPRHHRDPWDRLLIVQAMAEDLTIVTADPEFTKYDVRVIDASL